MTINKSEKALLTLLLHDFLFKSDTAKLINSDGISILVELEYKFSQDFLPILLTEDDLTNRKKVAIERNAKNLLDLDTPKSS